jgi:ParB-like chromosome segregation protein Spo0J
MASQKKTRKLSTRRRAAGPAPLRQDVIGAEIENLDFDPRNPRLPEQDMKGTQDELLAYMAQEYEAIEVARSIAKHGYFVSEPLIAIEERGRYVVVEGNRRLAALKLLRQPQRAESLQLSDADEWFDLASETTLPERIPIVVVDSREAVAPIVGYRHISGIEPWGPHAKARFLAALIDDDRRPFKEAAAIVGESERAVREYYRNLKIVRQMETAFKVKAAPLIRRFGVFTRTMQDARIVHFIGAPRADEVKPGKDPLPKSKAREVRELASWVFGQADDPPLFTDSRKISRLGTVVASAPGLARLRKTGNLDDAFIEAGGLQQQIVTLLDRAIALIEQAGESIPAYRRDEEVRSAVRRCRAAVNALNSAVA